MNRDLLVGVCDFVINGLATWTMRVVSVEGSFPDGLKGIRTVGINTKEG